MRSNDASLRVSSHENNISGVKVVHPVAVSEKMRVNPRWLESKRQRPGMIGVRLLGYFSFDRAISLESHTRDLLEFESVLLLKPFQGCARHVDELAA